MKDTERYVIRRGVEYLVAIAYLDSHNAKWSRSPWDAVKIPWREEADKLAHHFGGEVLRWTITGVQDEVREQEG